MLVKFFRSDNPITLIVGILITAVLLVVKAVFYDYPSPQINDLHWLDSLLQTVNSNKYIGHTVAFSFLVGTGFILNAVSNAYALAGKRSYFVLTIYILLSVLGNENVVLNTEILLNALVAILLFRFFSIANSTKPQSVIFDSSLLVALAALLNPFNLVLIIWVWVGIILFRSFYIRDWIVSLIGVLIPIIYLAVGSYFFDTSYLWLDQILIILPSYSQTTLVLLLSSALVAIPGILFFIGQLAQHVAVIRKMMYQVIILAALLFVVLLLSGSTSPLTLLAIPLSIMIGNFLTGIKKPILGEVLLILFVVLSISQRFLFEG